VVFERFQRDLKRPFFLGLALVVTPEAALSFSLRLVVSFRLVEPEKKSIMLVYYLISNFTGIGEKVRYILQKLRYIS